MTGHDHYAGIVSKGDLASQTDGAYDLGLRHDQEELRFTIQNGTDGAEVLSNSSLDFNTWYHIVALFDENYLKLYINGVLNNSEVNTVGEVINRDSGLNIGAYFNEEFSASWGHLGFEGIIDGVKIYKRALTEAEITANYNAYK
jgi:hypothetical protein